MINQLGSAADPYLNIRTTLEAQLPTPGILAIGAVLAGDGETSVAAGVARSLVEAGYRTLAIETNAVQMRGIGIEAATAKLCDPSRANGPGLDVIAIAGAQARAASAATIAEFYRTIRERYDFAIVDAGLIGLGGLPFARAADGVVLAVREGRAAGEADQDTIDLFGRLAVPFLGVIATRDRNGRPNSAGPSLQERLQPQRPALEKPVRGVAFGRLARLFVRSNG